VIKGCKKEIYLFFFLSDLGRDCIWSIAIVNARVKIIAIAIPIIR
jgi:hypothetical protein